jgi:hypothetical protein
MMTVALMIAGRQATTTRAADCAITNQPLRKEEDDRSPFLVVPKTTTRKKSGKFIVYFTPSQFFHLLTRLFCILSVFSSSQYITTS